MKKLLFFIIFICSINRLHAQQTNSEYSSTDEIVKQLGPLTDFNVATIADTITRKFSDKKDKVRAIFYWIANNISLDGKSIRSNDNKNSDPVIVTKLRKATPLGFANLVQEMSSMANIRCLVVDGYVKNSPDDINNKPDDINHSWNVVQLGQSPEEWHYIDAAKASGYLDKKLTVFTKNFTSEYFFPDKKLFNLDHFPDNDAWQLGDGPKSLKEFYTLPLICNAAYTLGIQKISPMNGYIKTKTKNSNSFSFTYNSLKPISALSLIIGEGNKAGKPEALNFTDNGGNVSFTYKFKTDNTYPVRIVADGKDLLMYYLEVEE